MNYIFDMKRVCVAFLISIFFFHGYVLATNNQQVDSIRQIVNNLPDTARLPYLEKLVKETSSDKEYRDYIRIYKEESDRQQNRTHIENSLVRLGRYFYPDYPDSLRAVMEILNPLLIESHNYKEYADIQRINIFTLIRAGKNEDALVAINNLREFSQRVGYIEGIEMADDNLGYFIS